MRTAFHYREFMGSALFFGLTLGAGIFASADSRSKDELEKDYRSASIRAVARDAFPVLFNPPMGDVAEGDKFVRPNEWVIGISMGGEAKAYPVAVMGFHELINDTVAGQPITVCW